MKKMQYVLAALLVIIAGLAMVSSVSAALPKDHADFMKDEDYKNAFEQFTLGMQEAKERLTPDEYKALEKSNDEEMATSVKEDMEYGSSEKEAYETAYSLGYEQTSRELKWDWLRKNAEDAQGFYKMQSDAFGGYMALSKGEEDGIYEVEISLQMNYEPYNSGYFYGFGNHSGSKMLVYDSDDENVITITFDSDIAKVTSTQAFKESGYLGHNVVLDADYLREKK